MKRIISVFLIVLYCAVVTVFDRYGAAIREGLAPHVKVVSMNIQVYLEVPSEAVHTDETGQSYVYFAFESDRYPEQAYEAERNNCTVYDSNDDSSTIILEDFFISGKLLIISSDKEIVEGRRVIVSY